MGDRLALDIGNTRTSIGLFRGGEILAQWRITTIHWTADDLWVILRTLLTDAGYSLPESLAYASVVPQVRHSVNELSLRYLGVVPVEVTHETAGVKLKYEYPGEIGADRLANVAGAILLDSLPAIIADFGTATTFDVIDRDGCYLGGVITPGVGTSASDLFKKAEKLSPVDLEFPDSVLGKSTRDAVCSGVLLGAVGGADYIVGKLIEELDMKPVLWATGGWAQAIAEKCRNVFRIYPELTITGIDLIGERQKKNG